MHKESLSVIIQKVLSWLLSPDTAAGWFKKKNILCESVDLVWGASVGVNTFSKVTENTKQRQTAYIS